jgi:ERF superfamily
MSETEDKRAILAKLHAIMKDCAYIQKDKSNDFHKYRYASEVAIKEKVHASMVEHSVVPQFNVVSVTEREVPKMKDGKQVASDWITTVQIYYRFSDVETGQFVEGTFFGTGADPLDKGCFKAITGALKYAITSQFLIATGDDPENDRQDDKHRKLKESAAKVDTGGQPVGTPAAQRAVAERKIAETKPKPASQDERFKMLEAFQGVKADIKRITGGEEEYYAVLGANGYEKSSQIESLEKARPIYEQLRAKFKMIMDSIETKGTAR